jgi:hypothetical protein
MINFNHDNTAYRAEPFIYSYDIHGIVCIASMFQLPELEYFRVVSLSGDPGIRVRLERRHKPVWHKERTELSRRSENNIHLHIREADIISDALKHIPTMRLCDPDYGWWQHLPVTTTNVAPTAAVQLSPAG